MPAGAGSIMGGNGGQNFRLALPSGITGPAGMHLAGCHIEYGARGRKIRLTYCQHDDIMTKRTAPRTLDVNEPFVGAQALEPLRDRGVMHKVHVCRAACLPNSPVPVEWERSGWAEDDGEPAHALDSGDAKLLRRDHHRGRGHRYGDRT